MPALEGKWKIEQLSNYVVLWNGVLTQKFRPARGVRQGCALSLYLFILCMEWLGHSICNAIGAGNWTPIKLSRNGPPLSHLFFADDFILFGHAAENQARVIKNILDEFCNYSGHRINSRKTNIFFSNGVDDNLRERISNFFGFQKVTNLGNYLGVPLLHDKVTSSTLSFVVERVRNKLSSWDARQLSLAGRVTLSQSVLLSIPSYFMQTMMIPKGSSQWQLKDSLGQLGFGVPTEVSWKSWTQIVSPLIRDNLIWSVGDDRLWDILWKFHGPHRIRFFIWLALKQRLLTNTKKLRRGFGSSSPCGLCGHDYEDVLHILRDCNTARGFAADGGCVRDHNGKWVIGFAKYLGNCTVLEAKLWGILDGLNLIMDRRFEKVLILIDSTDAINAILEDSLGSSNSSLIRKIHLILRKMEQ
ncbi:hypothetical protein J1N35_017194 [Gossypium stocksii]|uniref:Reverse transcriptase domain-containing protein n=1 Tax=Gossypium stocksii TaxID=47602 RepID=A0A9D3VMM2_9ROSI|nr:hypothetical protein J1N35_017194 [Gossypium stocksii]